MLKDRIKWNKKYRKQKYPDFASQIVKDYFALARGKCVLDIGAGNGRNAVFLAAQGFSVIAADISDAGLKLFVGSHPRVQPVCIDLDVFDIPENRFDLIINIKYLNRRLFPFICAGLKQDGVLIFETLMEAEKDKGDRRICRDYLLRENELLHAFLSLRIIHYSEKEKSGPDGENRMASLVAVRTG